MSDKQEIGSDSDSEAFSFDWSDDWFRPDTELDRTCVPYAGVSIDPETEIRVLLLQPGDLTDELCGTLVVQKLSDQAEQAVSVDSDYGAVSYAWGPWDDSEQVYLTDHVQPVSITRNLWRALRRLRSRGGVRRLWVDQVCINQAGFFENNHQVRLMGKVYSMASRVIVWLGEAGSTQWQTAEDQSSTGCCNKEQERGDLARLLSQALQQTTPRWWERTWVVHEVTRAETPPDFYFGASTMTWAQLDELEQFEAEEMDGAFIAVFAQATRLSRSFCPQSPSRPRILESFADVMKLTTFCSNPVDYVYAFFDLVISAERALLTVDYTRTTYRVFADATYAVLRASNKIEIMDAISHSVDDRWGFPSWVPNFAKFASIHTPVPSLPHHVMNLETCRQNSSIHYDQDRLELPIGVIFT